MVTTALLLAMCLILLGLASVQSLPSSLLMRDRIGVPPAAWRLLGFADLLAAGGLVIGALASPELVAIAAAISAVSLAVLWSFQLRSRSPLTTQTPVLVLLVLSLLALGFALAAA